MSTVLSAADRWVDDLENLLGLDPVRRPDAGTDGKRQKTRSLASLGAICAAAVAVGLTVVLVAPDWRGSSTSVARESIGPARSTAIDLPVVLPSSPARIAEASVPMPPRTSPDTGTGPTYGDALTQRNPGDRAADSRSAGRERPATKAQAVASAPALPSGERRRRPSAERTMLAGSGNLPPARTAFPDEPPNLARTAPDLRAGEAQPNSARLADSFDTPAAASTPAFSEPPSNDDVSRGRSVARPSNESRKKLARETGAIDALRMLRRQ